ncbi:hypothetical protein [Thalassospira sp. TSL5-1]|uniref:hypothetical protein n=1 Tax=Thalassospira sp. TSL5-1 TaxID=1544451 RepID=UPI00093D5968|nr:hypothetical protein [Thalassospira sp. TSL5-1]OKH89534.1 hypothetical protein LF95_06130 [Thalassospira sp. TSL5-1]
MNIYPNPQNDLKDLLGHFNVNVAMSDELAEYLAPYSASDKEALRQEFELQLKENRLAADEFRRFTACSACNEETARQFFKDVYAYAFEGGEEPDVRDYWNR